MVAEQIDFAGTGPNKNNRVQPVQTGPTRSTHLM